MPILRRRIAMVSLAIAILAVMVKGGGTAQAGYAPRERLPAVADFIADPAQLVLQFPNGVADIISRIRDLAASSPATLPLILSRIAAANPMQIDAIRTGLGQAALVCIRDDQNHATEIQQAVTAKKNDGLTLAFAAVLGDQPIGGLGGGVGGEGPTSRLFGSGSPGNTIIRRA